MNAMQVSGVPFSPLVDDQTFSLAAAGEEVPQEVVDQGNPVLRIQVRINWLRRIDSQGGTFAASLKLMLSYDLPDGASVTELWNPRIEVQNGASALCCTRCCTRLLCCVLTSRHAKPNLAGIYLVHLAIHDSPSINHRFILQASLTTCTAPSRRW